MENLPNDPIILLSFINMKLRDQYPGGLDQLCEDMDVDRAALTDKLSAAGFDYNPATNQFV